MLEWCTGKTSEEGEYAVIRNGEIYLERLEEVSIPKSEETSLLWWSYEECDYMDEPKYWIKLPKPIQ